MLKYVGLRSTRGKAMVVAAVVAMLSAVMAVPASAEGSHTSDTDIEVDTTAVNVPGLAELLDATDATVVDGVDVHANADTAVVFDSGDGRVEIPDNPALGVTLTSTTGGTITVGLPGGPDAGVVASDGSVVYNNAYRDTSIVVQPQLDGGARMITVLDTAKAPTRFDYPIALDTGQSMNLTADGGAVITGQDAATILTVPAPWAFDANGTPVAADYTLTGTTLTLNVHPTDTTVYPIIADPWLKRIVSAAIGALKGGGYGAVAGFMTGLGACVSTGFGCAAAPVFTGAGTIIGFVGGGSYCFVRYNSRFCRAL